MRFGILALGLLFVTGSAVQAEVEDFDCTGLRKGMLDVFQSVGPAVVVEGGQEMTARAGAVLYLQQRDVVQDWRTPSDASLLINGIWPLIFSPVTIGEETLFCTQQGHDFLFGKEPSSFLLSCLVDADKDGSFEGFRREAELVPINRSGKRMEQPEGDGGRVHPLPVPVTLVSAPVTENSRGYKVISRLSVTSARKEGVNFRVIRSLQYSALSDLARDVGDEVRFTLPRQNGAEGSFGGYHVKLRQEGNKWLVQARAEQEPQGKLLCDGRAISVGARVWLIYPGGMATLSRRPE